ncbi:RNA-directed DNA polymerase, eukaryota [Tanacetum coccineum]
MNFPDSFNAKDLWRVSNQYGTFIDTFIPDKRSKANKRYGFVRFIKADNVEHLVSNLCTIWVGKFRLHVNIARFQRKPLNQNSSQTSKIQTNKQGQKDVSIMKAANGFAGSFAHAVKKGTKSHYEEVESQPALVLDETCLNQSDMSTSLMGKVKTFNSLSNLKPVLAKEGFDEIKLKYMGGLWVLIDFQTITTKEKFMANTSVVSWFSHLQQAMHNVFIDERAIWVNIDGVSLKVRAKEECGWTPDFVEEEENESEYCNSWTPALVLDDSCLNQSDMSTSLMGKVKTFNSLSNLKPVLAKEGFDEIKLKYMGGLWVLIDFQTITTKEKFMANTSVVSWFSHLQQAMHNVFIDERAIWVNIDGVSLKVRAKEECGWTPDFVEEEENESEYDEMVSNEGDHEENGNIHNPNLVVNDSDIEEVQDTIFENSKSQNLNEAGCNVEHKHPHPFNIYDLLNKKKEKSNGCSSSDSNLKYPPGFTPSFADEDKREDSNVSGDENEIRSKYVQVEVSSPCEKEKEQNRNNGGHNDMHKQVYLGGSILQVMEDMVKVLPKRLKKIRSRSYALDTSSSVGYLGGILCVWDPRMFHKDNATVFDYFVMVRGKWIPNGRMILIISIYAPQELSEKKLLWDYLTLVIGNWQGDVVIMGDFNEVRKQEKRYGLVFNAHGADAFNLFISNAGLEEIHLGGCSFTWCHKSASKMSKLDRFLVSEGIVSACPNISALTLDRYLSDHRPILLCESKFDFGPSLFRFFHYWFDLEGFDDFLKTTWNDAQVNDHNAMRKFMNKLKIVKRKIREWTKDKRANTNSHKKILKEQLVEIDSLLDKGEGNVETLNNRADIFKSLQDIDKLESIELAHKAKIKWGIKGDENTKYYHGILNRQ